MKTDFEDITETQKRITIEIPSDVVDKEIDRVTKGYSKQARLPGAQVLSRAVGARRRDVDAHEIAALLIGAQSGDDLVVDIVFAHLCRAVAR